MMVVVVVVVVVGAKDTGSIVRAAASHTEVVVSWFPEVAQSEVTVHPEVGPHYEVA